MPQPIGAKVVWDTALDKATVADITVPAGNGATVIQWTCDPSVSSFTITGLDANEFNPAQSNPNVPSFTTNDRNDTAKSYSYTVNGTQAATGRTSTHDPKIENGGGG